LGYSFSYAVFPVEGVDVIVWDLLMAKTYAVGIDLGTTLSAVAYVAETGQTTMLRNGQGELLTPSVVLFDDQKVVVGTKARKLAGRRPGDVAECAKRDVGKQAYSRRIRGKELPPEVIQAWVLRRLKGDVVATLGEDFKAVITVPAFFDEPRRKSTADSGEMAGLAVLDIVNEPTAAALAYGEHLGYLTVTGAPREEMKVLVYDLGGGTFDVTLIQLKPGDLRTLATDGDVRLGGRDWDQRLVNHAAEAFLSEHGEDPRQDAAGCVQLSLSAEKAKHELSIRGKAKITVEHRGRTTVVPVTRKLFEELTEDLLERTAYTTRQVLAAAKADVDDVSRVLLVGGSTRMPIVGRMLEDLLGITPDHSVNPDEAVARGAAIYAHYLLSMRSEGGPRTQFKVVDVNSHSLGIEGIDQRTTLKENVILIPRNTPLPVRVTNRFATKMAAQKSIVIKVLEGESSDPDNCITIGKAVLRDLPPDLRKGHPIDVSYRYGANGRLDVRARVPDTDREVAMELQRDSGLSDERLSGWRQVVTSDAGFVGFDSILEEVCKVHDVSRADGSRAKAMEAEENPPFSGKEAADRQVRWSGQPTKESPASVKGAQPLTVADPLGTGDTPASDTDRPTAAPSESVAGQPPRRARDEADGTRGDGGNEAMPPPGTRKTSGYRGLALVVGYILSALLGLAIGALILRFLGVRLW